MVLDGVELPPLMTAMVPAAIARAQRVVPVRVEGMEDGSRRLVLATAWPWDLDLSMLAGILNVEEVVPALTDEPNLARALERHYSEP